MEEREAREERVVGRDLADVVASVREVVGACCLMTPCCVPWSRREHDASPVHRTSMPGSSSGASKRWRASRGTPDPGRRVGRTPRRRPARVGSSSWMSASRVRNSSLIQNRDFGRLMTQLRKSPRYAVLIGLWTPPAKDSEPGGKRLSVRQEDGDAVALSRPRARPFGSGWTPDPSTRTSATVRRRIGSSRGQGRLRPGAQDTGGPIRAILVSVPVAPLGHAETLSHGIRWRASLHRASVGS